MENQDIDKMFNEAGKSAEENKTFPGFEKVWENIEEKLDQKKQRIFPIWLPYGVAAGLALSFGVLYFINQETDQITIPQIVQKTNNEVLEKSSISDSAKIEKLNQEFRENMRKNPIEKQDEIIAYHNITSHDSKKIQRTELGNVDIPKEIQIETPPVIERLLETSSDYTSPSPPPSTGTKSSTVVKNNNIDGTVVTAMGIKKAPNTLGYATTTIASNSIVNQPNVNTINALQGKAAGLTITSGNGNPGNSPKIMIRGLASLKQEKEIEEVVMIGYGRKKNNNNGRQELTFSELKNNFPSNNQPLYVIDGILVNNSSVLENLNPDLIKSIHVLKDNSATALYGTRGSNGVIIVNIKKGKKQEFDKFRKELENSNIQNQIQTNDEAYDQWQENPFELAKSQPLSTFSIDVDNAAYSNIRRMINNGQIVDKNAVRIEEMINYFKYSYPQPSKNEPFSINTEYGENPWNKSHKLLKIGLQGKNIAQNLLAPSNLVFLIDVSGSMSSANKLPLLKASFKVLLDKLRPQDKVALVTYAGNAGVVLPPTSASEKTKILKALEDLEAGGSTAGGAGIELAYKLAQENFKKDGNNRVIIATDGDFNVGVSNNSDLQSIIEEKRKSGIYLTCLGFGMGNYKDNRLEMLANKGNGNYAYIDNIQEANKFLGKEFVGSMYTIAKDVKIQIEFNPNLVESYRLIGYENRKLRNEDFTNDAIDAGELGIGHTVTAIYEVIPKNVKSEFLPGSQDLKYSQNNTSDNFGNEIATIKFRYKNPDEENSRELIKTVEYTSASISNPSSDFGFSSAVAWFGLILRKSQYIRNKDLNEVIKLAQKNVTNDENGYRSEFVRLLESYKTIQE